MFFFFRLHYKCKIEDVTENIPLVHQENAYSLANFIQPALCKYFMPLSTQQSPPITKKRKKKKKTKEKERDGQICAMKSLTGFFKRCKDMPGIHSLQSHGGDVGFVSHYFQP